MDIVILDSETYYPIGSILEGFTTKIWTERYLEPGDFQLTTLEVEKYQALLEEDTLITHLDTLEVMMVEDHEIVENEDGFYELTITGRSVDCFMEQRWLEAPHGKKYKMANNYTCAEAAEVLLWNAFVNPSEQDVTHPIDWFRFSTDTLPNVVVSDSVVGGSFSGRRWLGTGDAATEMKKFLHWRRLGVRGIRPAPDNNDAKVITVGTGGAGLFSYITAPTTALQFNVFNGADRTQFQTDRTPVVFRTALGDVENPKYLRSTRDRKTVGSVLAEGFNNGGIKIWDKSLGGNEGTSSKGWKRRAMVIDAGDPESANSTEFSTDVNTIGQDILDEKKLKRVIEGKISPKCRYVYGRDYKLGDLVTMAGNFGITQDMRVSEYIRSEDKENGDHGYPGLEMAD